MFRFMIFASMCLLYIVHGLIQDEGINNILTIVCILAFGMAFLHLSSKNRMITGFLFLSGVAIHFFYGNHWLDLFEGITQNLALLTIILLAPLISLPLKGEGILHTVSAKLKEYRNDERKTFYGVLFFMTILAPILNMGALRIVHGFFDSLKIDQKLLSHAYYGGFTQAALWSPFFASVGIVISMAEMPYMTYMPVGIAFAFMQFVLAILMLRPAKNTSLSLIKDHLEDDSIVKRDFGLLFLFVFSLIGHLIILESLTRLPILLLVSINCLLIPFLWTLFRNKWGWMKNQMSLFKDQTMISSNMEISLFLSAGLFGNALMHTPIASTMEFVITWASQESVLLVFFFVVTFVMIMAFFGIHQIIAVPIVFPLLLVPEVEISLLAAAFTCIFSWIFSASLSPLNALNIIISSCLRINGFRTGFIWNGKYFLTLFFLALGYVILLNQL